MSRGIARSAGVPVIMTAGLRRLGRRPDRRKPAPIDLRCNANGTRGRWAQVPYKRSSPVLEMHGCTKTMVVTNHEFTPAARSLAESHGCELVGGPDLPRRRFD